MITYVVAVKFCCNASCVELRTQSRCMGCQKAFTGYNTSNTSHYADLWPRAHVGPEVEEQLFSALNCMVSRLSRKDHRSRFVGFGVF